MSSNNIGLIVREVCGAIVEEYRDEVINCPKTEEEWKEVAGNFATRWNLCYAHGAFIGNMSGLRSHPNPAQPTTTTMDFSPSSSSWPWWILPTNSCGLKLVLMVHAQIFNSSQLKQKILNGTLNIPQPEPLPGASFDILPLFLIRTKGNWLFANHSNYSERFRKVFRECSRRIRCDVKTK